MAISESVIVALNDAPDIVGTMIDHTLIQMNNPETGRDELVARAVVVWEHPEMRTPCPAYVDPTTIQFVGLASDLDDEDEDEDEEIEEGEESELAEVQDDEGGQ